MHKILVVGDSTDACFKIHNALDRLSTLQLFDAYGLDGMCSQMLTKTFNMVVVSHDIINEDAMQIIEHLKSTGNSFPILVISSKINHEMSGRLRLLSDIHMLVLPVLDKSIVGLARKLLQARRVPKQNYRRFNTNQLAEMETLSDGTMLTTSMYNLSKGGAYCEFDPEKTLSVGEVFRLKVYLKDTNSNYIFNAKVVWTTPKGRFSGRYGCGFRFINTKETNRAMLSKA